MIFGWIILFGSIWLLLVLFEPFVTYMEAGAKCDRKYASARERDEARMRELQEQHAAMSKQIVPEATAPKKKSKRQLKREAWKARRKEKKLANNSTDSKTLLGP